MQLFSRQGGSITFELGSSKWFSNGNYFSMNMSLDDAFEEDTMGMTVSSGSVKIAKDDTNLIGISIGGGAPLCPCVYVVQVFDNTPASRDGKNQSILKNNSPLTQN